MVDGVVQVYARTGSPSDHHQRNWDEDESSDGFQLLNEVGTGGTLSSLFNILSLLTEDVQISWQDNDNSEAGPDLASSEPSTIRNRMNRADSDVSHFNLDTPTLSRSRSRSFSTSSRSTVHAVPSNTGSPHSVYSPARPMFGSDAGGTNATLSSRRSNGRKVESNSYGTFARATEDATLAVIPAEAFRRLTKKFPKKTAHVVQGMIVQLHLR